MNQKEICSTSMEHFEASSRIEGSHQESSSFGSKNPVQIPFWAQILPFFMSAFFFLSTLFALFSPFPILFVFMKKGRKWAYLAAIANSLIVVFIRDTFNLALFFTFSVVLSLTLAELLKAKKSLEKSVTYTLGMMALFGLGLVVAYSSLHQLNPFFEFRNLISNTVDQLNAVLTQNSATIEPSELEEVKKELITEFPGHVAILSLTFVWANLVLLLKTNPNGIRESLGLDATYFRKWKAPELLVWPSLVAGFFTLLNFGTVSDIALNIFRFLMAIYVIQGFSILSYFFETWKLKKLFRWVAYGLGIFSMWPMVLCLGFFDLWFDFRAKFRQA